MSDFITRLREQRANVWEQGKSLLDAAAAEGRDLSAEESATWERMNADLDAIDARVKAVEEAEKRAADMDAAFNAIASREQRHVATPDKGEGLRRFLNGEARSFDLMPTAEERVLIKSTGDTPKAGNTVPTSFYGRLWEHLIARAALVPYTNVITTDSGENIEVPITTTHVSGALIAENSEITASEPVFAKRTLGAYKYATLFQISRELLQDSGVDIEGYLARTAGAALGDVFGTDIVVGNGSGKPSGVFQTSTLGVTGGASVSGAFTADNLIDLYYSVIAPYRNSPDAAWLMKDATVGAVRKLKGSDNNYLWQPGLQAGAPDLLLGKPIVTDPNVAAVALSAKSVAFGDMGQYMTRIAQGVRFERSDDYAFNTDVVTFRAIMRGDGLLVDQTGAVKHFIGNAA